MCVVSDVAKRFGMNGHQVFTLCDRFHRQIVNVEQEYRRWRDTGIVPTWIVKICEDFLRGQTIDLGKAEKLGGGVEDLEADAEPNCRP